MQDRDEAISLTMGHIRKWGGARAEALDDATLRLAATAWVDAPYVPTLPWKKTVDDLVEETAQLLASRPDDAAAIIRRAIEQAIENERERVEIERLLFA